jgi:hypothetical protein
VKPRTQSTIYLNGRTLINEATTTQRQRSPPSPYSPAAPYVPLVWLVLSSSKGRWLQSSCLHADTGFSSMECRSSVSIGRIWCSQHPALLVAESVHSARLKTVQERLSTLAIRFLRHVLLTRFSTIHPSAEVCLLLRRGCGCASIAGTRSIMCALDSGRKTGQWTASQSL